MNKTISYKESTAIAIQAMMSAARKDEYADRKRKSNFPQNRKKRDVTLKDSIKHEVFIMVWIHDRR